MLGLLESSVNAFSPRRFVNFNCHMAYGMGSILRAFDSYENF